MNKPVASEGPLVIAVDSSTTSSKAIIVDVEGNVLALGKREIPLRTPQQGFGEHDPSHWWTTTNAAIAEAINRLSMRDRGRIEAIGMTHQRETLLPSRRMERLSATASSGSISAQLTRSSATAPPRSTSSPASPLM